MKTPGLKTFNVATCLALWASSVVPSTAQSSDDSPLLPIEVKCPVEGSQNYAQVFRRADGLTIRYSIKYDGDTAIEVRAEVASESVFRIVDEIDLLSPTTDDEKKALAAAIISRNQPAFDAICRGLSADRDRYEKQLQDNARQQEKRP